MSLLRWGFGDPWIESAVSGRGVCTGVRGWQGCFAEVTSSLPTMSSTCNQAEDMLLLHTSLDRGTRIRCSIRSGAPAFKRKDLWVWSRQRIHLSMQRQHWKVIMLRMRDFCIVPFNFAHLMKMA